MPRWVLEESKDGHGFTQLAIRNTETGLYCGEIYTTLKTLLADRQFAHNLVALMNREGLEVPDICNNKECLECHPIAVRITGVIKGRWLRADTELMKRDIPARHLSTQSDNVTVEFLNLVPETMDKITSWFHETTLPVPVGGFPEGTLLIISRHEKDILPSEMPLTQPAGHWTVCHCNHIAQEHGPNGKCEECKCQAYTGHFVPGS